MDLQTASEDPSWVLLLLLQGNYSTKADGGKKRVCSFLKELTLLAEDVKGLSDKA